MMAVDTRKSAGQLCQAPWGQQGPMMVTVKLEEDHPKNQGLSLPENQLPAREIFRQQFRHFCYQDSPGPRLALSQLQELCHQWLRPETHAKEEILDLLVLEQFLSILPQELQVSVREHHPESGEEAVTELENLERKRNEGSTSNLTWMLAGCSSLSVTQTEGLPSFLVADQTQLQFLATWTCDECGKTFSQLTGLRNHKRIHTGDKTYQCPECGKAFTRGEHLIEHQGIHNKEKPYQCKECGKAFTQKTGLSHHIKIHTGEKPFECSECGRDFSCKSNLNKHKRVHSEEKSYTYK
ncbi:hypothetical protein MJG53_017485 [Ovis ammon polii x Ovis aries]|uniref:Uncharacterized protein n=1 Tax=Ovis ammon polii x Ovis aries TaxID=2918886 RepID=A0ACB9U7Z9_9CETA|nr:hypothetical protein MJG53_017485 [Ovis ammon polii x Ovis aries]